MGKRIIQQRRGRGGSVYRVRSKAGEYRPGYLADIKGEWEVVKLLPSPGHSVPLAKIKNREGKVFYNFACNHLFVGQKINFGGRNPGDISKIGELKNGTRIFNIENRAGDGGKLVRSGGNSAEIINKSEEVVTVWMPSRREKKFSADCRATVGVAAGSGKKDKPVLKAGKKFYIMKSKSKLWPKTSAVSMNAIDHPFGSGRGKRVKSKIAKRYAAPGKKVGMIRPKRTGRKKR